MFSEHAQLDFQLSSYQLLYYYVLLSSAIYLLLLTRNCHFQAFVRLFTVHINLHAQSIGAQEVFNKESQYWAKQTVLDLHDQIRNRFASIAFLSGIFGRVNALKFAAYCASFGLKFSS